MPPAPQTYGCEPDLGGRAWEKDIHDTMALWEKQNKSIILLELGLGLRPGQVSLTDYTQDYICGCGCYNNYIYNYNIFFKNKLFKLFISLELNTTSSVWYKKKLH